MELEAQTNNQNENKLLIITHVADPDGITPIILAHFAYKTFDKLLLNPNEVDQNLKENIEKYEEIHIIDLSISEEYAKEINQNEKYKTKIKIFDHHQSSIYLNNYPFAKVIIEQNGIKESGTSIYYNYLKRLSDNKNLHKNSTKGLVNQVRLIDTYDFKTEEDKEAHNIDSLFTILGRQNYIDYFINYIKQNEDFQYNKQEKFLIKLEQDKMNNYIEKREQEMITAILDNHNVGIVYAERYRSDLGNYLANKYPELDFIIIINISKSISFRGLGKIDLSVFASKYKGGGHKNASGCSLPPNLINDVTKLIFKDIKIKEENK